MGSAKQFPCSMPCVWIAAIARVTVMLTFRTACFSIKVPKAQPCKVR